MKMSKTVYDTNYPMKCLRCSMQWRFDSDTKYINFHKLTVREIMCPGCGALSVPVEEYSYYQNT